MRFIPIVEQLQHKYPISFAQANFLTKHLCNIDLKKALAVLYNGKKCQKSLENRQPFPKECENPFTYTADLTRLECLELLVRVGKYEFKESFDSLLLASAIADYNLAEYDSPHWLNHIPPEIEEELSQFDNC